MSQTNNISRNGKKWSVNETLKLQREYELLELSVQEIASLHQRTVDAILFRLLKETFIDTIESARGYTSYTPEITPVNAKDEFISYIDTLLSENKINIEEIQNWVLEKATSLKKNKKQTSNKPKRVLRRSVI
jgi:hypothetical protein